MLHLLSRAIEPQAMLRADFTHDLAEQLLQGRGVRLYGEHGLGRRETLADLASLLPDECRILKANLRNYPDSLSSMLSDLTGQADTEAGSLASLLTQLQASETHTIIILHNFDELNFGKETGYDPDFIDLLNGIGQRDHLSLLTVTVSPAPLHGLNLDLLPLPPLP